MAEHPEQMSLPLPPEPTAQSVAINGRYTLRTQEGWRVLSVGGLPVHHYRQEDRVAEAYAMVCLVQAGFATRVEVARGFGCSSRTVRRHLRRYAAHGMAGLDVHSGWKAGAPRLSRRRLAAVSRLKASGTSNREIARQLGVAENAIREVARRWLDPKPELKQLSLPGFPPPLPARPDLDSAREPKSRPAPPQRPPHRPAPPADKPVPTLDTDPADRWMDRFLACLGLIDDAVPLFRSGERIPRAGVLLTLPPLVASGIFAVAKEVYGDLAPAFYGLRTTILARISDLMTYGEPWGGVERLY